MKQPSLPKRYFVSILQDLPPKNIFLVGKNISTLFSVKNLLPSQVSLPSALVAHSSLFEGLMNDKKEVIKKLIRQFNGADGRLRSHLTRTLQNIVLHTPLTKTMERGILTTGKKLFGHFNKQSFQISAFVFSGDNSFSCSSAQSFTTTTEKDFIKFIRQSLAFYFSIEVVSQAEQSGYEYASLGISLLVQRVLPTEVHGTLSSFHEDSGFEGVVEVSSFLGQSGLPKKQGLGDHFLVSKDAMSKKKNALLARTCGQKSYQGILTKNGQVERVAVPPKKRDSFSLSEAEVLLISQVGTKVAKQCGPCRLDWQKVGEKFFLESVEPVSFSLQRTRDEIHTLLQSGKIMAKGLGLDKRIAAGKIHLIQKSSDLQSVHCGDILLIKEEVSGIHACLPKASAVIVGENKKEASFALEARELALPVVVVPESTWSILKNGKRVTVSGGNIYEGTLPFEVKKNTEQKFLKTKTKVVLSIENPDNAFSLRREHADGVGMLRFESLFTHLLPLHPLSIINYPKLPDKAVKTAVELFTRGWSNKKEGAKEILAGGIATVAAAFFPSPVTIYLCDFTSREFLNMTGAVQFKKVDPLRLFNREASDERTRQYREAFGLQCQAIKKVRDDMGFTNIIVMAPFCHTPEQAEEVIKFLAQYGLKRGENGLQVHGRYEIPANFILAKEFTKIFDGFSLDTMSLSDFAFAGVPKIQSGKDRYNPLKTLVKEIINLSHSNKKSVSFAFTEVPDSSDFIRFLIQQKIDSLSFPADLTLPMKEKALALEKTVGRTGDRTHKGFLSMVVGIGAVAAILIGLGAGCNVDVKRELEQAKKITESVPPARIREEVEKNFKAQIEKFTKEQRVIFSETGFANFTLQYSISWKMNHGEDGLRLQGEKNEDFFSMYITDHSEIVTSTEISVGGLLAHRGEENNPEGVKTQYIIEIPLQNKKILSIKGFGDQFEKILASIVWGSVDS